MENQHNSLNTTKLNTDWIESLAFDEINMDEAGVVDFNEHLEPQALEEESIRFMNSLETCLRFSSLGLTNAGGQTQLLKSRFLKYQIR